jgi:hypothetical protein
MFMKTTAIKSINEATNLKVLHGYAGQQETIASLIKVCCDAAYVILWNGSFWSDAEKKDVAYAVKRFLLNAKNLQDGYTAFIQRLILARQHMHTESGLIVQAPDAWFDERNKKGFTRTSVMFDLLQHRRRERPLYKIGLKGFADALIEFAEEPSAKNFHYWRNYFAERNSQHLLNLFLSYAGYLRNKG